MATEILNRSKIYACVICGTIVHKSNKQIQCALCSRSVHRSCVGSEDGVYYCTCCLSVSLPFSCLDDLDLLNLLGYSSMKVISSNIEIKLNLDSFDSIENKFIDNEGIDADSNHFNYVFTNIFGYSDTDQMNKILPTHASINLKSILHLNARSLVKNQDALYANLQTLNHKFSILAITETWTTVQNEAVINVPGYSKILKSRVEGRGGGLGLFFDLGLDITIKMRDDLAYLDTGIMESMFVQSSQNKLAVKDIIVGVIYRPPNTNVNTFSDCLSGILDKINKEDRPCYLLGDFNIDLINPQSESFLNIILSNSFHPRIDSPTRLTDTSATLIDNVFINTHSNLIKSGVWLADISDHLPIFITLPYEASRQPKSQTFAYKRHYSSENMERFKMIF